MSSLPNRMHCINPLGIFPCCLWVAIVTWTVPDAAGDERFITLSDETLIELRSGVEREWSDFPENLTLSEYHHQFDSAPNSSPWTLTLRQQDVKESWTVSLNDQLLGRLVRDENDLQCDFEIAAGILRETDNELTIRSQSKNSDDIRIGNIKLYQGTPTQRRSGSTIEVVITDTQHQPLPGRITIVNEKGTLIPTIPIGSQSPSRHESSTADSIESDHRIDARLAAREGVVYTASGHAYLSVQPGKYRIYAGRGFEYSVADVQCEIKKGQHVKRTLILEREVDTTGWIACDTHVHTVTYSGHGDCTLQERLITLAGEGIELPIATDHNTQIDYSSESLAMGTAKWFTPVVGNEVTTKRGHFNIFPTSADAPRPNHQAENWSQLFDSIFSNPTVQVAILNHARDLHSDFRPFSPRHHISLSGTNLDGFDRRFNAMELINSGAVQTDPMELFRDWCGLINHGMAVTPIGSSDSHDVSRYIVGQGRTYIAGDDRNPGELDVSEAAKALVEGRVVVSYGLFADLAATQNAGNREKSQPKTNASEAIAGPGELLRFDPESVEDLRLDGEVRFPSWSGVSSVELWMNGQPWRGEENHSVYPGSLGKPSNELVEEKQPPHQTATPTPVNQIQYSWVIPREQLTEDTWFTLVAVGQGINRPHWPTAKPYQPDSIEFNGYVFSCTGPIQVDMDGDGAFSSARQYALKLADQAKRMSNSATQDDQIQLDLAKITTALETTSPAVTAQLFAIVRPQISNDSDWLDSLSPNLRSKIAPIERAWKESVRAKLEHRE